MTRLNKPEGVTLIKLAVKADVGVGTVIHYFEQKNMTSVNIAKIEEAIKSFDKRSVSANVPKIE